MQLRLSINITWQLLLQLFLSKLITCSATNETEIAVHLESRLSSGARIITSRDVSSFANATSRWSSYRPPNPTVVIEAFTEEDVQEIVRYAWNKNVPILARNQGHGSPDTLASFQGGILIAIQNLNSVSIDSGKNLATIGGGALTDDLIHTFYAAGKQAALGSCSCVGLLGASLGGGHGRLQGLHGLMADNIVSARVVLADGTLVVANASSHSDLFWGLRGAGHNFGIVTEIVYQIYDLVPGGNWTIANFEFSNSTLEAVVSTVNTIAETQSAEVAIFLEFAFLDANSTEPSILVSITQVGVFGNSTSFIEPFHALGPSVEQIMTVPWPDVADSAFSGKTSPLCEEGLRRNQYPVLLENLNISTMRKAYDSLADFSNQTPEFRSQSSILIERYATQGVKAVPASSTAYPHRFLEFTALTTAVYSDPSLDDKANEWGRTMRSLFQSTSGFEELNIYMNYAQGDESLEAAYGYEAWRLERLRGLKSKYDPRRRFSSFEPITI